MQIVRTIVWVLILFAIFVFSILNWDSVEVTLWDNLVLETKVPALVIIAFLLGLIPMWLYHRSVRWSLKRRIRSLESSIKSSALPRRDLRRAHADRSGLAMSNEPVDRTVNKPVNEAADTRLHVTDNSAPVATSAPVSPLRTPDDSVR